MKYILCICLLDVELDLVLSFGNTMTLFLGSFLHDKLFSLNYPLVTVLVIG